MQNKCVISGTRIFTLFIFNNLQEIIKAIPEGVNCVIHGTNHSTTAVRAMTRARIGRLCHSAYTSGKIKSSFIHGITAEMRGSAYRADLHTL